MTHNDSTSFVTTSSRRSREFLSGIFLGDIVLVDIVWVARMTFGKYVGTKFNYFYPLKNKKIKISISHWDVRSFP